MDPKKRYRRGVLEMKLAEQMTEMKDPGFSLEIVATMAAILLGASSTQSGP